MKIESGFLNKISFGYLSVSLFIFLACWLKLPFAFISILSLYFILKYISTEQKTNTDGINIKKDYLVIAILICILWCFLAGIGGYFWQISPDWEFRNALFRDLTQISYPVLYSDNTALVYYFGFMLPAAVITKFLYLFSFNNNIVWDTGNFFLLIWSAIGLFICSLQLFVITNSRNIKSIWVLLIFILFSGMDLFIGRKPHTEWHMPYSYLSNNYQLFLSYHIAIPIWLLTTLLWQNLKKIDYYGFLATLFIFFCPQTIFPVGIIMLSFTIREICENFYSKTLKNFCKKIFDKKNILALLFILPFIYVFFKSNYSSSHAYFYFNDITKLAIQSVIFSVGFYILIVGTKFYKNILFWLTSVILILLPFIAFKTSYDFLMRADIPLIIILMIYVIKFLFLKEKKVKIQKYFLITVLLIGSITPIADIFQSYDNWNNTHSKSEIINDNIKTFRGKITLEKKITDSIYDYRNYASIDIDNYIFWKYFANKNFVLDFYKRK